MRKIIHIHLLPLICIGSFAEATPWGLAGDANISVINGMISLCIPPDEKSNIAIESIWITESSLKNGVHQSMWDVQLKPGNRPVTLAAGECLEYGKYLPGYSINTSPKSLEAGTMYSARLNRFMKSPSRTDVLFFTTEFCPSTRDGELEYLQYTYKEGKAIAPQCKRNQ
jgi:hypothetical protein